VNIIGNGSAIAKAFLLQELEEAPAKELQDSNTSDTTSSDPFPRLRSTRGNQSTLQLHTPTLLLNNELPFISTSQSEQNEKDVAQLQRRGGEFRKEFLDLRASSPETFLPLLAPLCVYLF
tara:strand:+ start:1027 stop:1386 length:360 start_codon:yes stop_codon:yes gene_type:complete